MNFHDNGAMIPLLLREQLLKVKGGFTITELALQIIGNEVQTIWYYMEQDSDNNLLKNCSLHLEIFIL